MLRTKPPLPVLAVDIADVGGAAVRLHFHEVVELFRREVAPLLSLKLLCSGAGCFIERARGGWEAPASGLGQFPNAIPVADDGRHEVRKHTGLRFEIAYPLANLKCLHERPEGLNVGGDRVEVAHENSSIWA